jgi:hypothetical protein
MALLFRLFAGKQSRREILPAAKEITLNCDGTLDDSVDLACSALEDSTCSEFDVSGVSRHSTMTSTPKKNQGKATGQFTLKPILRHVSNFLLCFLDYIRLCV